LEKPVTGLLIRFFKTRLLLLPNNNTVLTKNENICFEHQKTFGFFEKNAGSAFNKYFASVLNQTDSITNY